MCCVERMCTAERRGNVVRKAGQFLGLTVLAAEVKKMWQLLDLFYEISYRHALSSRPVAQLVRINYQLGCQRWLSAGRESRPAVGNFDLVPATSNFAEPGPHH